MKPNVIIESKIPFIGGILDEHCNVKYLAPEAITAEAMREADALITRTRTRCDRSLLDGSRCRFIATATIGTDHIDLNYCQSNGITVANAPGCNAPAVAQYVMASIIYRQTFRGDNRALSELTIGIVGVGHVGSIVESWSRQLGMRILLCDPPRAEREGADNFVGLNTIAEEADIITFHTPLTRGGKYPTYHICDAQFLSSTKRCPIIIDSARGAIVDTAALVEAIDKQIVADAIIDCWENEPAISPDLLQRAVVATPHIAGYSREGKIRATSMTLKALCDHFSLPTLDVAEQVPQTAAKCVTAASIMSSYSPELDTIALKSTPDSFESFRNNYNYRLEVKEASTKSGSKHRAILIGLGNIAGAYCRGLQESPAIECIGVCDVNSSAESQQQFISLPFFHDYNDAISTLKPDIAIIATPPHTHCDIITSCHKHGVAALVEKPLVATEKEFIELQKDDSQYQTIFHWLCGNEVIWFTNNIRLSQIESITIEIDDPFATSEGTVKADYLHKGGCWLDSGINALSLLSALIDLDNCVVKDMLLTEAPDTAIPIRANCRMQCGATDIAIRIAWDNNRNHKQTVITTPTDRYILNHSLQSVEHNGRTIYCDDKTERLTSHYYNFFINYPHLLTNNHTTNRIHNLLYEASRHNIPRKMD